MTNERFLLEFCDTKTNDVIEANEFYQDYIKENTIMAASLLLAHQQLDINTYIETVR